MKSALEEREWFGLKASSCVFTSCPPEGGIMAAAAETDGGVQIR